MTFTSKVNKRARPLLGTVVEIGVIDTEAAEAQELISESFLKIENIEPVSYTHLTLPTN